MTIHVLGRIYVFFTLFGYWAQGGRVSLKGLVHNLLVQFFTLGTSKIEVFETHFSDTVITQNHPSYVKHVLSRIYVVFTVFGHSLRGGGVGGSQGMDTQPAYAACHTIEVFETYFSDTVIS